MRAGGLVSFTQARAPCQPRSADSFSTRGFISARERGDAAERDGDLAHASMGGMKIN